MTILLLCDRKSAGENMPDALRPILVRAGHEVQTVTLNRENLKPCIGCFGCWFKTPGQCVITNDAANSIAASEVRADAVVVLSEITYGGYSADIKAFLDRSIQNILPYFEKYKGEIHHEMRYERFPAWIMVGYGDADDLEKQTFGRLAERNDLNLRPWGRLTLVVRNADELVKESGAILKLLKGAGA